MSAGAVRVLERAIEIARRGQCHPHTALIHAAEVEEGDEPRDQLRALLAIMNAAGCTLTAWYEGRGRKPADTVALLEDAVFRLQLGA